MGMVGAQAHYACVKRQIKGQLRYHSGRRAASHCVKGTMQRLSWAEVGPGVKISVA